MTRQELKELLGPQWTVRARCLARGYTLPRWGNLRRTEPFSSYFGFERGTPVDRYYLDGFLADKRAYITGDVLEIQCTDYTHRYGHELRSAHSVDINPAVNPTYVCDLALSDGVLPDAGYDCFLLPNTFQHLQNIEGCLRQILRVVRPGGVILATAAGLLPLIPDGPDYWRFSAAGWREMTNRVWSGCEIQVRAKGNCLSSVAAMLGLALEELSPSELDVEDPRYPVLVTIFCKKPMLPIESCTRGSSLP